MLVIPAVLLHVSKTAVCDTWRSDCEYINVLLVTVVQPLHVARWVELQR